MKKYKVMWYSSVPFLLLMPFIFRFLEGYNKNFNQTKIANFALVFPSILLFIMCAYYILLAFNFNKILQFISVRVYSIIAFAIFVFLLLDYFLSLFSFTSTICGFFFSNSALVYVTVFSAYYGIAAIYSVIEAQNIKKETSNNNK